ncbi:MAG: hypothetical protein A3I75_05805 [Deltaproteobacteria bacterium RIFCSPLOWO2_02_FULL_50_16]|nr:MAG: hypothetical protein A3B79_07850 [Deltaproteobacteria bacterium RIFCSPHIGHO2_02_FULL_50_15]OGQ56439.1 MAG: hypothetical protein A3I75_05805 [Deltaproteobacteria bacterium RIFCSPLOWO2_02_FULL_50_16]OGQ66842.1 MAG: hypothetical protein A3F89_06255 [Deltaproteobacteria bacterium RIFCSPLOWO2_12_FULL_50_11]
MNLPDYNFLSAPLPLITLLHIFTFSLHLIAMNFMLGGVIIVLWGGFNNRWEDLTVQKFVKLFPTAMAATISLGIPPFLFLQLVYSKQVYAAAIMSGWFWLMIIPVLVVTYYCFYSVSFSQKTNKQYRRLLLWVVLLGLLYVSFIYSSIFSMAERPAFMKSLYTLHQSGVMLNTNFGDYLFRWGHMVFGAITIGGFFIGLVGRDNAQAFSVGKTFFLGGMIVTALLGTLYLFTLNEYWAVLMRRGTLYFLSLGIILSFSSLHFFFRKKFMISGTMVFASLITMVTTRHSLRLVRLAEDFDPSLIKIDPQWSIVFFFLFFFVLAIALIGYMLRLYFND